MKYEKGTFTTIPNIKKIVGENPVTQTIYLHLCYRANKDGICFPSIKQISKDVGSSKNTVRKYLQRLIDLGLIEKNRRFKDSSETSSEYQIIVCPAPEGGSQSTGPPSSNIEVPTSTDGHRTKETKLNDNFNNTSVLLKEDKEYGDPDINNILKAIKDNNDGLIDGTKANSRKYGNLLKNKISKIKGFGGDYYSFIDRLIKNTDEFQIGKTTSPEKIYFNLATLIAKIKYKKNNSISIDRGEEYNFLGNNETFGGQKNKENF